MSGETDLGRLLATMDPVRQPGRFAVVTFPDPSDAAAACSSATILEPEGWTYVVPVADAEAHAWPHDGAFAWITLQVHSSLQAVGLTAAVATALAAQGISANVIAAYHHDHLLIPVDRAADALSALQAFAG